ncbi:MAG: antibiotic biosynthesis monooxygenase [Hyphomicrobiales bacterium]|nr:antibiotic biosynthesis monooxygenase [Hyphomicrobiales bacterium]
MFIVMNRFCVVKGQEPAFEAAWLNREVHINREPGFVAFHLLKGGEAEDHTLYISHTMWADYAVFEAWTKSESFRLAHKDAGQTRSYFLGGPQLEMFDALQVIAPA